MQLLKKIGYLFAFIILVIMLYFFAMKASIYLYKIGAFFMAVIFAAIVFFFVKIKFFGSKPTP